MRSAVEPAGIAACRELLLLLLAVAVYAALQICSFPHRNMETFPDPKADNVPLLIPVTYSFLD